MLRKNFTTYDNAEDKLLGKWAYMDASEDAKSINIIDKDGNSLGTIRRKQDMDTIGDNYLLTLDDKTKIIGHKEEKGWSVYDVTNNGYSLAQIDNDSYRAKCLKTVFLEAKRALQWGGRRQRCVPTPSRCRSE